MNAEVTRGHGTKFSDRIVSLTANIIEVSEVLAEGGLVESDILVNRYVFNTHATEPYLIGQAEKAQAALALAARFVVNDRSKIVIVRARSIDVARVLYERNKGFGY